MLWVKSGEHRFSITIYIYAPRALIATVNLEAGTVMSEEIGFTIRLRPDLFVENYRRVHVQRRPLVPLLQAAFPFVDPFRYRGLGRPDLDPFASLNADYLEWMHEIGFDQEHGAARRRYRELLRRYVADYEHSLLKTADEICEVYALIDAPDDYEILYIRQAEYQPNPNTLGFDVGNTRYSLINDAILCPLWHPAPPEDFALLAPYYRTLNEHVLFSSAEDARAYLDFYCSRSWSEQGSFACWQIDRFPCEAGAVG